MTKQAKAKGPSLSDLLSKHSNLTLNSHGKLHCSLSGHDIKAEVEAVQAYLASDKYKKACTAAMLIDGLRT